MYYFSNSKQKEKDAYVNVRPHLDRWNHMPNYEGRTKINENWEKMELFIRKYQKISKRRLSAKGGGRTDLE